MSFLFSFLVLTSMSHAAVPRASTATSIKEFEMDHALGVKSLKQKGAASHNQLRELAFDSGQPMKTRWKAFMLYTQVKQKASFPIIKKALLSKTWYMRSAGLTALQKIDRQAAKKWAYSKLNQDPALLVRMKAFEILKNDSDPKIKALFWKKLHSKENVHKNKSLWIRSDLAKALMKLSDANDSAKWARLLYDQDEKIRKVAALALGRIHRKDQSQSVLSLKDWQAKYPQSKTL